MNPRHPRTAGAALPAAALVALCALAAPAAAAGGTDSPCAPVRLAVEDLAREFGPRYPGAAGYLDRLGRIETALADTNAAARDAAARDLDALRREALLANPLLDIDRLLVVVRGADRLGLPRNWQGNSSLPRNGYDNEIAVLTDLRGEARLATLYRPPAGEFVGDVDLDFDATRLLFSMPAGAGPWRVFELPLATPGAAPAELALIPDRDVDNYDACYLPDGNLLFTSSAPFTGVPCVAGSDHVANLYRWDRAAGAIRRLTFEQDHDWCPTVMPDGRILYLRWEYSDLPHFVSRILFTMNPDGTAQNAFYGSNSYWPNAMFHARPLPGRPSQFVAVVGGHHDNPRMGELVLFDAAGGRREAEGALQRIPGRGKKVEPILLDGLTAGSWPKFLNPWPLNDRYFLVAARPTDKSGWGLYLADVFDNLVLLKELPGKAILEPIPLRPSPRPPVIPNRVQPDRNDAVVHLADVYRGPGLEGVPRGTVKKLRLFTYHFAYHGVGGQVNRVGLDGPWDIKAVVGTVPVAADGSATFRIPANTPLSVQPLDAQGQALQLMRSWFVGMPGETVSCVGCHERGGDLVPPAPAATAREPAAIEPWYGPVRGFSFSREVQPVLDRHCVACHDGSQAGRPNLARRPDVHPPGPDNSYKSGSLFPPSYLELFPFVRGATIESDMHLLTPAEYHAGTTMLVQMLRAGHHGVVLDAEGWDRLITWIDLNKPAQGTWHEIAGMQRIERPRERRTDLMRRYAGREEDFEVVPGITYPTNPSPPRAVAAATADVPGCPGWPFDASEARRRQEAAGAAARTVDLGGGIALTLRRIPAGEFVMGGPAGAPEALPPRRAVVSAFWMAECEISNAQFALFDPSHDSRLETGDFLQFSHQERGWPVNGPAQPVVRVSWRRAMDFCRWLSAKTGGEFTLPTEAQWEYACRAGSASDLWFGDASADFSTFENLADRRLGNVDTWAPWHLPSGAIAPWRPAVMALDDGHRVTAPVGTYKPNPWGLKDMHGNAAEWTRTAWTADGTGADLPDAPGAKVVKGGSWYDRPARARSAHRLPYEPWQRVFNVGFRVVSAGT